MTSPPAASRTSVIQSSNEQIVWLCVGWERVSDDRTHDLSKPRNRNESDGVRSRWPRRERPIPIIGWPVVALENVGNVRLWRYSIRLAGSRYLRPTAILGRVPCDDGPSSGFILRHCRAFKVAGAFCFRSHPSKEGLFVQFRRAAWDCNKRRLGCLDPGDRISLLEGTTWTMWAGLQLPPSYFRMMP